MCKIVSEEHSVRRGQERAFSTEKLPDKHIAEHLLRTSLIFDDFILCEYIIDRGIPIVSKSYSRQPINCLKNIERKPVVEVLENLLQRKLERHTLLPKDAKIYQITLTKNAETGKASMIVYVKQIFEYPFSEYSGVNIIWRAVSSVNPEATKVARKLVEESDDLSWNMPQISGYDADRLFRQHSNLNMVSSCPIKSVNFGRDDTHRMTKDPCVVLYCRSKGEIPLSENGFPKEIAGFKTDVREGYCTYGVGDLQTGQKILPQKCLEVPGTWGTLGGFVKRSDGKISILTCAHLFRGITDNPHPDDIYVHIDDPSIPCGKAV